MSKCCTMFNINEGYCRVYTILHLVEIRRMEEERTIKMSVNDIVLVIKHNFAAFSCSKKFFRPTCTPQNKIFAALAMRYVKQHTHIKQ
jgi:hypothetical protein